MARNKKCVFPVFVVATGSSNRQLEFGSRSFIIQILTYYDNSLPIQRISSTNGSRSWQKSVQRPIKIRRKVYSREIVQFNGNRRELRTPGESALAAAIRFAVRSLQLAGV